MSISLDDLNDTNITVGKLTFGLSTGDKVFIRVASQGCFVSLNHLKWVTNQLSNLQREREKLSSKKP